MLNLVNQINILHLGHDSINYRCTSRAARKQCHSKPLKHTLESKSCFACIIFYEWLLEENANLRDGRRVEQNDYFIFAN